MVVSIDPSHQPGSHWTAFYQALNGPIEMFHSFGKDLTAYFLPFLSGRKTVAAQNLRSAVTVQFIYSLLAVLHFFHFASSYR